jgi:hypothetical protein
MKRIETILYLIILFNFLGSAFRTILNSPDVYEISFLTLLLVLLVLLGVVILIVSIILNKLTNTEVKVGFVYLYILYVFSSLFGFFGIVINFSYVLDFLVM